MKKLLKILCLLLCSTATFAIELQSPNGNVALNFDVNAEGRPYYSVSYKGKAVVSESFMGLKFADGTDYSRGFAIHVTDVSPYSDMWRPVWGEQNTIEDNHIQMVVTLWHAPTDTRLNICFRAFDDCVAFRYELERQPNLNYIQLADEVTEFAMTGDHKTFWIPGNPDSQEYYYITSKISEIDASKADGRAIGTHKIISKDWVQTPLMMKSADGLYINLFEAALSNYPAMMLSVDRESLRFTSTLAGSAVPGVKAFLQTPCKTPWRTIIVSDKAEDILASKTILNLNEPCAISNTEWIKPQKMVGVWWEMHVPGHSSWNYSDTFNTKLDETDWAGLKPNGRHGANTENVKRYIDFAAANGLDGVLVEGWNIGWEDWAGNWKEEVFDFVTPYPDFNVEELTEYAKAKGVKIVMHHETSGSAVNYERRIDSAISFMKKWGYNSVKTGYVGWCIPRGEPHDGQWMVNHYERVIKKMADAGIMIDEHESVRPTGQSRTYPNLMACEAARGNEYNAWSYGNPPEHETILPFTRLMGGPMDYTPGIFKIKMSEYQPGNGCQVHTTLAKQLALYVTMYSPIQMAADLIENYEEHIDAFQFIKDVPLDWKESRILEAEPGDYITIARKAKNGNDWYIGAITDENARTAVVKLDFLEEGVKYIATVYADGKDAHWQNNPESYEITTKKVSSKSKLTLRLAAGGGCAVSIKPAE